MLKKTWTGKMAAVLMSALLAVTLPLTAFADGEPLDPGRKGSITVTLAEQNTGKVVKNGKICLYQVADLKKDGSNYYFSMLETFAGSGVQITATGQDEAAKQLADYAETQQLEGNEQSLDENGTVRFTDLSLGIYLAVQTETASSWYPMTSFLVSVPMQIDGNGIWLYDLNANPKVEAHSIGGNGGHSGGNSSHGGGGSSSSVTTSQVVEITDGQIPLGTIVTDIVDGEVPLAPMASLPQTGQLNWPVPVMAISGLILFAIGWYLAVTGEKKYA